MEVSCDSVTQICEMVCFKSVLLLSRFSRVQLCATP